MNYLQVDDLEPGMEFDQPVYIEGNSLFVPAGIKIKQKDIERLRKWKIVQVETEGHVRSLPPLFQPDSQQMWGVPSDAELFQFYSHTVEKLNDMMDKISRMENITREELDALSGEIVTRVKEKQFESVRLILCNNSSNLEFAKSAFNTAIMALNIGISLGLDDDALTELADGALLHDVGMLRVPDDIKTKDGQLEKEELQTMRSHPLFSYQIIKSDLGLTEDIAQVALQHHERWDGEGYPQALKGDDINYLSRITSIADAYEAMISERPYRNSMVGYEAMKNILSDNCRRFDPDILKIFIRSMGIYPLGSLVMMSDSSIARVIGVNKEAPLRPEIILLIDAEGTEYRGDTGPSINLLENKTLFITRALDIKDLLSLHK
ncbi:MAG: HD-GYP domain-containing protein [Spirochaetales bacterium]|nr:HD-GYP domain-containing protein [Spirochaetales bacterium]